MNRITLKEIVEEVIKEEYRLPLRVFVVYLKIKFHKNEGGTKEQKLAQIRAISGVTIVESDASSEIDRGRYVISNVKIKFHPRNNTMSPRVYIKNFLIREINSTKLPGIHVIGIMPNSLQKVRK